jgi:hypothetical protein
MAKGLGRRSDIDLLPAECDQIISWAAQELTSFSRTQVDIYGEFKEKLIALQGEQGIGFDIPSYRTFSRHSVKLAKLSRRLEHSREIAAALSERFNTSGSDDLTLIAAEAIKSLILETIEMSEEGGISPKGAMELANALRAASAAQASSSNRRLKLEAEAKSRKVETEMKQNAEKVFDALSSEPGISKEAIARARREFLGVRPMKKKAEDSTDV